MDAKKKPVIKPERAQPKKRRASHAPFTPTVPTRSDYSQDIIGTLREPLLVLDADLRVLSANRSFYKYFKAKAKETLSRPIYELGNHQWDIPALHALLETILPQKAVFNDYAVEHEFPTIGRRVMLLNARRIPRPPEDPQMILLAFEDVTERRRLGEVLQESETRLRAIFDNSPDTIYTIDLSSGEVAFLNRKEFWGYSVDELKSLGSILSAVHPEDLKLVKEHWEGCKKGDKTEPLEYRLQRTEGDWGWIEQRTTTLERNPDHSSKLLLVTLSDITGRKKLEEEVHNSEIMHLSLLENSVSGISQALPDGRLIYANRTYAQMYGYESPEAMKAEVSDIGRQLYAKREDREEVLHILEEKGFMEPREMSVHRRDGTLFTVLVAARKIQDPDGNLVCYQAEHIDFSEHKRAEEALRESEERYRPVQENSLDAILLTAPDGSILAANPAACEMFQMTEEEICRVGRNGLVDINDPRLPILLEERGKTGKAKGEVTMLRKDGSKFPAEIVSSVYIDRNGEQRTSMTIRDITERKRAEEALLFSESKFAKAFLTCPEAMSMASIKDGKYLDVNEAFLSISGFQRSDVVGHTSRDLNVWVNMDDRNRYIEQLNTTGQLHDFETQYRMRSGSIRDFLVSATIIEIGGETYSLNFIQDITERKQAEEALHFRIHEAEILSQAAASLTSSLDLSQVLNNLLSQLAQVVPYDSMTVFLQQDEQLLAVAGRDLPFPEKVIGQQFPARNPLYEEMKKTGLPQVVSDAQKDPRFQKWGRADYVHGWMGIPMIFHGELIGGLTVDSRQVNTYDETQIKLALAFANQAAIAIQNARLYEQAQREITERKQAEQELAQSRQQLRLLSQRLQAALEDERAFIAREIHDEFGQALTALKMDLAWLSRQLPPEKADLICKAGEMSGMVDGTIQLVRRVAGQLRPGMLDDLGLAAALEWQAGEFQTRTGIPCRLDLPEQIKPLSREQSTALFRVFQETLTNVTRHAQASLVRVALKATPQGIELLVRDNGIGITPDQLTDPHSLGLIGMRERMQAFGGTLQIKNNPGGGTSVIVRMPVPKEA